MRYGKPVLTIGSKTITDKYFFISFQTNRKLKMPTIRIEHAQNPMQVVERPIAKGEKVSFGKAWKNFLRMQ